MFFPGAALSDSQRNLDRVFSNRTTFVKSNHACPTQARERRGIVRKEFVQAVHEVQHRLVRTLLRPLVVSKYG